jgi:hypothetical protein
VTEGQAGLERPAEGLPVAAGPEAEARVGDTAAPATSARPRTRTRRIASARRGRATRRRHPSTPCLNCGDPNPGRYCPSCGQKKIDVLVSVRVMIGDELEDEFVLNRRLPRTLFALFFQPGFLTREYVNGRIASYARPLKLYLVSSLIFFLLLSFFTLRLLASADLDPGAAAAGDGGAEGELTVTGAEAPRTPPPDAAAQPAGTRERPPTIAELTNLDSLQREGRTLISTGVEAVDSMLVRRIWEVAAMTPRQAVERLTGAFLQYVPMAMFILLPLFGLVLKLLYLRERRFYVEHFVFLLHLHAFIYLIFTLMLVVRGVFSLPGWLLAVSSGWMALYILLAMRRVYGQSWAKTLVKYGALGITYVTMLLISVPIVLVVSFLLF